MSADKRKLLADLLAGNINATEFKQQAQTGAIFGVTHLAAPNDEPGPDAIVKVGADEMTLTEFRERAKGYQWKVLFCVAG